MSYVAQDFSNSKSRVGINFGGFTMVVSTGAALRSREVYELVMAFGRVVPIAAIYAECGVSIGSADYKDSGSPQRN